jgi:dolichol-phosphate mannosyltransferase
MKKIAVVIPAYCESENIVDICKEILVCVPNANVVVVDDSPDLLTVKAIHEYAHPQVQVIRRESKGGRGSAVIEGIKRQVDGAYDYYLEIDADFSHPPKQIPELIAYAEKNKLDLLIACRYLNGSQILNWPLTRRVFSKCANLLARTVLKVPVSDYTNGFRLYSKRAAIELTNTCGKLGSGFIALSEILVNLHYRQYKIGEVPTIFVNRIRGQSSLTRKEISNALIGLRRIYQLRKRLEK